MTVPNPEDDFSRPLPPPIEPDGAVIAIRMTPDLSEDLCRRGLMISGLATRIGLSTELMQARREFARLTDHVNALREVLLKASK